MIMQGYRNAIASGEIEIPPTEKVQPGEAMTFEIVANVPMTAEMEVRLETLRQIMRLPDNVRITGVEIQPNGMVANFKLAGYGFPSNRITASYDWESQPVLRFKGWVGV